MECLLLSLGDPPELQGLPCPLLTDAVLTFFVADVDLSDLAVDPLALPFTGRLSRSASSIRGLGRFADSERRALVTCE